MKKKVDYAGIFVNMVKLGVRDFLPATKDRNPLRMNLVIVYRI